MGVRLTVAPQEPSPGAERFEATYEFDQDRILVGRGRGADVNLPHRSVSVRHATIEHRGGRYQLVDHGSTNGTRVGGQRLVPERPKPLRDGDQLQLGAFLVTWRESVAVTAPPSAERTASLARRLLRGVLAAEAPSGPRLLVLDGPSAGAQLLLPPPPARLVIGRGEQCDLALGDAEASREHVEVLVDLDGALARDLGSKNGLVVGDRSFTEKRLRDRDEILVGASTVLYEDASEAALASAEAEADELLPEPPPPPPPEAEPVRADAPVETPATPTGLPENVNESKPLTARPSHRSAELFVYALAAMVVLASLAGLFALMRAE